jgi:hypothetical protein
MAKLSDGGRSLIDSAQMKKNSGLRIGESRSFADELLNDERVAEIAGTDVLLWDVVEGTTETGESTKLLAFTVLVSGLSEFSTYLVTEKTCGTGSGATCLGGYRAAARIDTWVGFEADEGRASGQSIFYGAEPRSNPRLPWVTLTRTVSTK